MIGVHTWREALHVHPIKVWQRHSPTMFLPHVQQEGKSAVAGSFEATELLSSITARHRKRPPPARLLDRLFLQARLLSRRSPPENRADVDQPAGDDRREDRILSLARAYLTLEDLLEIKARMIGTGFVAARRPACCWPAASSSPTAASTGRASGTARLVLRRLRRLLLLHRPQRCGSC